MDNTVQVPSTREKTGSQTQGLSKWISRLLQYMNMCCLVILLIAIALVVAFYFNVNLLRCEFREKQLIAYVAMVVVISWFFSLSVLRYVFRIRSLRFIIFYPSPTLGGVDTNRTMR